MCESFVKGKNAFVIGGTSSIGLCISRLLLEKGAKVYACGTHNPHIGSIDFIECNFLVNGISELEKPRFSEVFQECDVLCVCYGPFVQKALHETTFEEWKTVSLLDYALPGIAVSKVLSGMMERKVGSILLFGGTRSEVPRACSTNAAYLGAKTGLDVIVKSVARDYGMHGINCNAILPGFTRNAPDGFIIEESVVAQKAVYILEQRELNGVLLNVDRGWM